LACHAPRFEVDDEERLAPDERLRIVALLLHAGEDLPDVIAQADSEFQQLRRIRYIFHALDSPEPDVDGVEGRRTDERFDRRRLECRVHRHVTTSSIYPGSL